MESTICILKDGGLLVQPRWVSAGSDLGEVGARPDFTHRSSRAAFVERAPAQAIRPAVLRLLNVLEPQTERAVYVRVTTWSPDGLAGGAEGLVLKHGFDKGYLALVDNMAMLWSSKALETPTKLQTLGPLKT